MSNPHHLLRRTVRRTRHAASAAALALTLGAASVAAQGLPFLADSIVALKVGGWNPGTPNLGIIDNAARTRVIGGQLITSGLTDTASIVFINEYRMIGATTGSGVRQTIEMPSVATASGNRALTMASNSGSEGALRRSADGRYLTMAGYNQSKPAAPITASTPTNFSDPNSGQGAKFNASVVNRVIGRIDAFGNVDTTTTMNNASNGDNIRSAASTDGSQFWTSGNIGNAAVGGPGSGGVRTVAFGGTTSSVVAGTVAPGAGFTDNVNKVDIYNGQLYAAVRSGANNGIWAIGSGTPTAGTSAAERTRLIAYNTLMSGAGFASNTFQGPYDFFFANDDTLYIADSLLGISKFNRDGNGIWGYTYNIASTGGTTLQGRAGGVTGLAGRVLDRGEVALYGTTGFDGTGDTFSGNMLIALIDTGPGALFSILDIAGPTEHFKGVALAPLANIAVVPVPSALGLMLGGLLLIGTVSRRGRVRCRTAASLA